MRYVGDRRGGWKRAIKIDCVRSIKARSLATQTYHVKKEHHDHEDEPEKQLAEHVEMVRPLVRLGGLVVGVVPHGARALPTNLIARSFLQDFFFFFLMLDGGARGEHRWALHSVKRYESRLSGKYDAHQGTGTACGLSNAVDRELWALSAFLQFNLYFQEMP